MSDRGSTIIGRDPAEAVRLGAEHVAELVDGAVRARGACHLALAGGNTPGRMHEALAQMALPWPRLHVWFGDERCVPPDNPDSNFRMARESLLDRVPIPPAQVHRMEGELADRERAAADYAALLPPSLDVLLLGIGQDGHTASLFPHAPSLHEARRVVAVTGTKPPPHRLTITPPVIAAAREIVVLASGADKAAPVRGALDETGPIEELPVRLARRGTWVLDEAAASLLNA
jgi:6-phosphogluconolactonase